MTFNPTKTLDQVITSHRLSARPSRQPDTAAVQTAVLQLTRQMAKWPEDVLQLLAETALELCKAHTVGISVLEHDGTREAFKWRGLAGKLAQAKGLGMPRNPSPCGMVLDEQASFLMTYPEHHFEFPGPVDPPIVEVLLTPFFDDGRAVGTIWVVAHDDERKFDNADLYAIDELSRFASQAYTLLISLGYIQSVDPSTRASLPRAIHAGPRRGIIREPH